MCGSNEKAGIVATQGRNNKIFDNFKKNPSIYKQALGVCIGGCACAPVLAAAGLPGRLGPLRLLEELPKDGLELAEDDGGDLEVALQSLCPQPEVLWQARHVDPLSHLREELDKTGGWWDGWRAGRGGYDNITRMLNVIVITVVSNLSLAVRRILVRETQLPSIRPLPTVGVEPFLQAAYREQANQCTTSPCAHACTNTHTNSE